VKMKMKVVSSGIGKIILITMLIYNFVLSVLTNIGWTYNGIYTTVLDTKSVRTIVHLENGRCLTVSVNLIVVSSD
jgi:hypothetical protein